MDFDRKFYLGRPLGESSGEVSDEPLLYDPDDLTTHAVVVGMTGSGKTGLCLDLLEEAALNDIPALMIDPKGDITNALLHFPELLPADFQPWINADQARREGKSVEQAAADTANLWRNGLAKWAIGPERIKALKESAQFTIFTPGSTAGIPLSILSSLEAPKLDWAIEADMIREKITGIVTALMGLVGLTDMDPVQSREHILLSSIFEDSWRGGSDLSLSELILQVQNPPFDKLGVFDVDTFYPSKDRFGLAMRLNNILASPSFQSWIEGEPLDIQALLYTPEGKPRHSVFYIAHLNDAERMFFVSLLFSSVESWMRSQKGSTSLRALLYFDEIFGYLPPLGNPPSKPTILRMLKQARAFGVGLLLATQNPVDVDYKALSNAGTWFIGKLQTDQDKQRLLDGLAGASGGIDRSSYDQILSALGKRVFLLHNVHEKKPVQFNTRWAMNYLAGPLTRTQIPALNELAGVGRSVSQAANLATAPAVTPHTELTGSQTKPAVPDRIAEYFLPNDLTINEALKGSVALKSSQPETWSILYRPVLLARADIRFTNRKYQLDHDVSRTAIITELDRRGFLSWEEHIVDNIDPHDLDRSPALDARFAALEAPLSDGQTVRSFEADFLDWAYRSCEVEIKANEKLDIYAGPDMSEPEFQRLTEAAAEIASEKELKTLVVAYKKRIERVEDKLTREERELREDEAEYSRRKREEAASHAETVISLFMKRRKSVSSSLSKRSMTERAKEDVEESEDAIEEFKEEIEELEVALKEEIEAVEDKWLAVAGDVSSIAVAPYKKDIAIPMFGIAWLPYYILDDNGRERELYAFSGIK